MYHCLGKALDQQGEGRVTRGRHDAFRDGPRRRGGDQSGRHQVGEAPEEAQQVRGDTHIGGCCDSRLKGPLLSPHYDNGP